jgi:hypothetical protein
MEHSCCTEYQFAFPRTQKLGTSMHYFCYRRRWKDVKRFKKKYLESGALMKEMVPVIIELTENSD